MITKWIEAFGGAIAAVLALLGFGWLQKKKGEATAAADFARRQAEQVVQVEEHLAKSDRNADAKAAEKTAEHVAEGSQMAKGDHLTELLREALEAPSGQGTGAEPAESQRPDASAGSEPK